MHRVIKVLLCLAITVGGFFSSYDRAHAAAPVVVAAGGIEVGAGVYVGAALGVAGLAALVGYEEYSDEIKQHAYETWNGAQQVIKDSFKASVDAAVAAGDYTITLSKQVVDYFRPKQAELAAKAIPVPRVSKPAVGYESGVEHEYTSPWLDKFESVPTAPRKVVTKYPAIRVDKFNGYDGVTFTFPVDSAHVFVDSVSGSVFRTVALFVGDGGKTKFMYRDHVPTLYFRHEAAKAKDDWPNTIMTDVGGRGDIAVEVIQRGNLTVEDLLKTFSERTTPATKALTSLQVLPVTQVRTLHDAFDASKFANPIGTVFPLSPTGTLTMPFPLDKLLDSVKPATGTGTLVWNPTARAWELDGIPYTGTVSWEFPVPRVDVGTGEVVIPDAGTANPPASGVNIPPFSVPSTAAINLDPLKVAGDKLTTKFPFSIPWDVQRQLSVFNVSPVAPVLHVDKQIPVFGRVMSLSFDIDFRLFDPVATVVRWFLILAFDVAIILSLRRFLPE